VAVSSARCSRHGRLPDSSPLDDPELMPPPARIIQLEDTGGIRIILAGVAAARPLRRGQRSASASGMTPACTCGRRYQSHGNPEDPAGGN
jgi:hypothetical protein